MQRRYRCPCHAPDCTEPEEAWGWRGKSVITWTTGTWMSPAINGYKEGQADTVGWGERQWKSRKSIGKLGPKMKSGQITRSWSWGWGKIKPVARGEWGTGRLKKKSTNVRWSSIGKNSKHKYWSAQDYHKHNSGQCKLHLFKNEFVKAVLMA